MQSTQCEYREQYDVTRFASYLLHVCLLGELLHWRTGSRARVTMSAMCLTVVLHYAIVEVGHVASKPRTLVNPSVMLIAPCAWWRRPSGGVCEQPYNPADCLSGVPAKLENT